MTAVQIDLGISQAQLACLIGVDVRTLRRWREGRTRAAGPGWTLLVALNARLARGGAESLKIEALNALQNDDALQALLTSLLARV